MSGSRDWAPKSIYWSLKRPQYATDEVFFKSIWPSGLGNNFRCKRITVQTLLSLEFAMQINLEHHIITTWDLAQSWSISIWYFKEHAFLIDTRKSDLEQVIWMNCEYLKNVFSIKRVCGKIAPGIQWNIRKVAVESLEWTPWNFSKSTCERFSLHSPLPQLYRGFNWGLWISLLLVQIRLKYLLQESCNAKTFSTNLIIYFLIDSDKQFVENRKLSLKMVVLVSMR